MMKRLSKGKAKASGGGAKASAKASAKAAAPSELDQLRDLSVVVADTGDFEQLAQFEPEDSTTNPSLVYAAAQLPQYKALVEDAIAFGKAEGGDDDEERLAIIMDKLAVNFGLEILKIVKGLVSTEVDARLSFNKEATKARAHRIIQMYEDGGVSRDRILIKIASTWEGIEAAKELKADGINCNLTLLFAFCQAQACAEAGVKLISPFVGRIRDWHQKANGGKVYSAVEDPGVVSVTDIYNYYKRYEYDTIIMGASFRSKEEIIELAGCDRLTIAPKWLEALQKGTSTVEPKLTAAGAKAAQVPPKQVLDESAFRWSLNQDAMATEKLSEGIRNFAADLVKLEGFIKTMM